MNNLFALPQLKNRYFVMRHGQSLANCEGLIVSTPENGILKYGLSDHGRTQAKTSALRFIDTFDKNTKIISSDFKRARETAEITHKIISFTTDIDLDIRLRERDFGDFELQSDANYHTTWNEDGNDAAHTLNNVESVDAVTNRVTDLIIDLEKEHQKLTFILVAHGDTLDILDTAFQKRAASTHRDSVYLDTAEIRELSFFERAV